MNRCIARTRVGYVLRWWRWATFRGKCLSLISRTLIISGYLRTYKEKKKTNLSTRKTWRYHSKVDWLLYRRHFLYTGILILLAEILSLSHSIYENFVAIAKSFLSVQCPFKNCTRCNLICCKYLIWIQYLKTIK